MPQTTESATFDRPQEEVFRYLADMSNLSEWDPSFEESERLDSGPLGEGSRFHIVASIAGATYPMTLELVTYDEPSHVVFKGEGEGLHTTEDLRVEPSNGGCTVTYESSYESDKPDFLDAAGKPAYTLIGKAAINGMRETLGK